MKKFKTVLAALLFALSLTCLAAVPVQAKVKLNKAALTLREGESATLKITGTKKKVSWKSSNRNVATVNKKGKVTGVAPGSAVITAKIADMAKKCRVTVTADYAKIYEYQIKYGQVTINKLLRISDANLVIPETIEDCPVVELADGLFKNCGGLETVTLPSGVSVIGDSLFYGCSALREVKGGEISALGAYAFYECRALEALPALSGVSSVGDYAFYNCDALKALLLPSGVKSVGAYAFYDCDSLAAFFGPEALESIGDYAFKGCDTLMLVNGCKNVRTVGTECFADCKRLGSASFGNRLMAFGTGCFSGCESLNAVSLPTSLSAIPARCFYNCYALTNVTIPTGVTTIGSMAFFNCIRLSILTIPGTSLTSISADALAGVPLAGLNIYYRSTGPGSYIESWLKGLGIAADHVHTI